MLINMLLTEFSREEILVVYLDTITSNNSSGIIDLVDDICGDCRTGAGFGEERVQRLVT